MDIRSIAGALGGDAVGRNRVLCPGPGHSRQDRSLSVTFNGDSFVCHSFTNDDWRECKDYVRQRLGLPNDLPQYDNDNPSIDVSALADERVRVARGMAIWRNSKPVIGTPAESYLRSRGLFYGGDSLRFHPSCPFRKERHPAMVALMVDAASGEPKGVHRTALLPDGSGKAAPGKMMLGSAKGAVVKLSADEDVTLGLAIAEGIETALAVPFRPVWACLSGGTMAALPVLPAVQCLTIFADNDQSGTGQRAANECGQRWHGAGREVEINIISEIGADFADTIGEAASCLC